ncbi:MAG: outer membrane beta-barrel protein [Bacteroidota bacterium]
MIRSSFILILSGLATLYLSAQPADDEYFYGFKAGMTYGSISDVGITIIPDVFAAETYEVTTSRTLGFVGGIQFYHRFRDSRLAIQPEILFGDFGSSFDYTDELGLEYQMNFRYQHVSLGTQLKVHPMGPLHFAAGLAVNFAVSPEAVDYSSNMPELGPDLQIQQSLREVLRGGNDIQLLLGAGVDFNFGLQLEVRYRLGLRDVLETQANGFGFIENPNRYSGISATLGWWIPFPD